MGAWEAENGLIVLDEALDVADSAIFQIANAFRDDLGRSCSIQELLYCLQLAINASDSATFRELKEGSEVASISAKLRKGKKQQSYRAGDLLAIPLPSGFIAVGIISIQYLEIEFFNKLYRGIVRQKHVDVEQGRFHLSMGIDFSPIESWSWRIIGHVQLGEHEYQIRDYKAGIRVTCSREYNDDGYIDVSMAYRSPVGCELSILPNMGMLSERSVVQQLSSHFKLDGR